MRPLKEKQLRTPDAFDGTPNTYKAWRKMFVSNLKAMVVGVNWDAVLVSVECQRGTLITAEWREKDSADG